MSRIICMWSGPRNLSTAMMRSFGSRADCAVWDEPFFAPFLAVSGKDHPGREETLAAHETDPEKVAARCAQNAPDGSSLYFQKHMPHHMVKGFPKDWMGGAKHFFLIREPARVIASYAKGRGAFDLEDLGFTSQRRLWEQLGRPPVIDSADILNDPAPMLQLLCGALDIPWDKKMLSWEAGTRSEDGAWAPYWYHSVQNSTGFAPPSKASVIVEARHQSLLTAVQADFNILYQNRIKL